MKNEIFFVIFLQFYLKIVYFRFLYLRNTRIYVFFWTPRLYLTALLLLFEF